MCGVGRNQAGRSKTTRKRFSKRNSNKDFLTDSGFFRLFSWSQKKKKKSRSVRDSQEVDSLHSPQQDCHEEEAQEIVVDFAWILTASGERKIGACSNMFQVLGDLQDESDECPEAFDFHFDSCENSFHLLKTLNFRNLQEILSIPILASKVFRILPGRGLSLHGVLLNFSILRYPFVQEIVFELTKSLFQWTEAKDFLVGEILESHEFSCLGIENLLSLESIFLRTIAHRVYESVLFELYNKSDSSNLITKLMNARTLPGFHGISLNFDDFSDLNMRFYEPLQSSMICQAIDSKLKKACFLIAAKSLRPAGHLLRANGEGFVVFVSKGPTLNFSDQLPSSFRFLEIPNCSQFSKDVEQCQNVVQKLKLLQDCVSKLPNSPASISFETSERQLQQISMLFQALETTEVLNSDPCLNLVVLVKYSEEKKCFVLEIPGGSRFLGESTLLNCQRELKDALKLDFSIENIIGDCMCRDSTCFLFCLSK